MFPRHICPSVPTPLSGPDHATRACVPFFDIPPGYYALVAKHGYDVDYYRGDGVSAFGEVAACQQICERRLCCGMKPHAERV